MPRWAVLTVQSVRNKAKGMFGRMFSSGSKDHASVSGPPAVGCLLQDQCPISRSVESSTPRPTSPAIVRETQRRTQTHTERQRCRCIWSSPDNWGGATTKDCRRSGPSQSGKAIASNLVCRWVTSETDLRRLAIQAALADCDSEALDALSSTSQ